jgi:two-component system cell cycle response regulator
VTALDDQPEDRVRGLKLVPLISSSKPVSDVALFCRIQSLVRLKCLTDELRIRAASGEVGGSEQNDVVGVVTPSRIMLVDVT